MTITGRMKDEKRSEREPVKYFASGLRLSNI
jgi:hypothetical protein